MRCKANGQSSWTWKYLWKVDSKNRTFGYILWRPSHQYHDGAYGNGVVVSPLRQDRRTRERRTIRQGKQDWLVNGHSCTANNASHSTDDSGRLLLDCCCPSEQVIASHRVSGPSRVRFSKNDDTKRHNSGQRRSLQQFDHDIWRAP